jgi:hypothetical protein
MKNGLENKVKGNIFKAVIITLLSIVGFLAAIFLILAFVPEEYAGICSMILILVFTVLIIVYAVRKRRQTQKMFAEIEKSYNEGTASKEEYKEMITTKSKFNKIAIICFGLIVLLKIIQSLTS